MDWLWAGEGVGRSILRYLSREAEMFRFDAQSRPHDDMRKSYSLYCSIMLSWLRF